MDCMSCKQPMEHQTFGGGYYHCKQCDCVRLPNGNIRAVKVTLHHNPDCDTMYYRSLNELSDDLHHGWLGEELVCFMTDGDLAGEPLYSIAWEEITPEFYDALPNEY